MNNVLRSIGPARDIGRELSMPSGWRRTGKFEPPFYGFNLVSTPRTRKHINNPSVPKLITVCAPTGYGKTTFLTQLYQAWTDAGRLCLWISLDEADSSTADMLVLLHQAIDLASPPGTPHLHQDGPADLLDAVIRRLAGLGDPVLFLDNLHFCTDPEFANLLDALVFTTGAQLRLVLAGGGVIPFDAGRARLELNAIDLGPKDLSFDAAAVLDLSQSAGLHGLDIDAASYIVKKTEGWPAAIRLIHAAMAEEPGPVCASTRFSGADADLAAMLNKRLLTRFDAARLEFLLELSTLRTISAELATAATGRPEAAAWIGDLVRMNALIFPTDRQRHWFRFHGLFRDFLGALAIRKLTHERRKTVLEQAARWCHEHGQPDDAAEYALSAPALDLAREIMDCNARSIVSDRGDFGTYLGWVSRADDLGIEIGIESEFWYAWALAFSRRCVRAQQRATNLERRLRAMPRNAPAVREMTRRLVLLRVMLCVVNDDMEAAHHGAVSWLQTEQVKSPIYTMTAALAAATSLLPSQNYVETRRYIQIAQGAVNHIHGVHSHAWMATTKALLDLEQGNAISAEQILADAHARTVAVTGPDGRMATMLATLHARAIADLGRSEEAREILRTHLLRSANHGFVDTTRHGLEAAIALGNCEDSGQLGFAALEAIASDGPPRLRRTFAAAQIRRLCLFGETARAIEIADQVGIGINSESNTWQPSEILAINLAKIDLLAAQDRIKMAHKLAEQMLRQANLLDRRREVVELHLTIAGLYTISRDSKQAIRSISRAVTLAAPRGLVQPFLQHEQNFKYVLQTARMKDFALTLTEQIHFFELICKKTGATLLPGTSHANSQSADMDALTRREIEMLSILESGPSNQQMADQLLVSVQTVKWHLYNLYAKLGVKNRAAALAKARTLKILAH